jgi:hypothetical protein
VPLARAPAAADDPAVRLPDEAGFLFYRPDSRLPVQAQDNGSVGGIGPEGLDSGRLDRASPGPSSRAGSNGPRG